MPTKFVAFSNRNDSLVPSLKLGFVYMEESVAGRFRSDDPRFEICDPDWVPILLFIVIGWTPSFCRKKWFVVSITCSSRDIWT